MLPDIDVTRIPLTPLSSDNAAGQGVLLIENCYNMSSEYFLVLPNPLRLVLPSQKSPQASVSQRTEDLNKSGLKHRTRHKRRSDSSV